jgi:hypothetical protein
MTPSIHTKLASQFEGRRNHSLESERTVRKKDEMKIAIIGTGNVGFTLGKKWDRASAAQRAGGRQEECGGIHLVGKRSKA